MNLSELAEQLARRTVRSGFRRNNSALIVLGGLSLAAARLTRHPPKLVYQEELPVGTKLTISVERLIGGRVPPPPTSEGTLDAVPGD
jgi:hypothetical protein